LRSKCFFLVTNAPSFLTFAPNLAYC
jgi:hypothetical protein